MVFVQKEAMEYTSTFFIVNVISRPMCRAVDVARKCHVPPKAAIWLNWGRGGCYHAKVDGEPVLSNYAKALLA